MAALPSILVLTSSSGIPDTALIDYRAAFGGGGPTPKRQSDSWVEIELDQVRIDAAAIRRFFETHRIDANIVAKAARQKRLLVADMDSTIITVECIDELAEFAGVRNQVSAVTDAAMRGEIDFAGALRARVALLRGLDVDILRQCYDKSIVLSPGALTLVRTMNAAGAVTALVSGGFTFFTERVADSAGFSHNRANILLSQEGALTGEVAEPILGPRAKVETMLEIAEGAGIAAADVIAVGDGANDVEMVRAAGMGVAYRGRAALKEVAKARLQHSDLTALLSLQGMPPDQWR